jgi:hypothetical protein
MSKAHYITPLVPQDPAQTVRFGTNAAQFVPADAGKLVKLAAESQYNLCAAGDPIEGVIAAVDNATSGGHSIGSIYKRGAILAVADGLQATPGTGTLAVGDYVVAGSITALGTALTSYPKVCKATMQPGVTEAAAAGDVNDQLKVAMFPWRVVSLGSAGTGAVGTTIVIERV